MELFSCAATLLYCFAISRTTPYREAIEFAKIDYITESDQPHFIFLSWGCLTLEANYAKDALLKNHQRPRHIPLLQRGKAIVDLFQG